ncbi:MAG: DUF3299 domain-containing protein [Thiolinea sp.]
MKKHSFFTLLLVCSLAACGDKGNDDAAVVISADTAESAAKANINQQLSQPLPDNAPEIGTDIATLVKPGAEAKTDTESAATASGGADGDVTKIMWEDLIPEDFQPEVIMAKYQQEIDNTPEGAPEEKALFDKIMAEFNNAPPNETLSGKQVKIPGFVTPLDEHEGMVSEFLLVPYFGSCIHSPPPPVNQTILVRPQQGKSIKVEQIYEPVWVTGQMKVEFSNTTLAQAGYLIESAELEIYQEEPGDEAAEN